MTTRTRWLLGTAVSAVGVYALMWIGYLSEWKWLIAMDSAALDLAYRYGVDAPGLGDWHGTCSAPCWDRTLFDWPAWSWSSWRCGVEIGVSRDSC